MKELVNDPIYKKLETDYEELLLDYILLEQDGEYMGKESHREAVITAITCLGTRERVGNYYDRGAFTLEPDQMRCETIDVSDFFFEGSNGYWLPIEEIPFKEPADKMNYWLAFFNPPYPIPYTVEDFRKINHMLFPVSQKDLEIYSWNDDFSDYFDIGKDWWGTAMWSVYDKAMQRYVIIGASLSD
ncbi:MAG: hypothetical protein K2G51_14590 [Lachnospiraceae bacterium]|nr:hypothetical protein [Lachnospiraceae bacterium]MDE7272727.1 hypothetical protein [Lachnospiraceae bacterium]